MKEVSPFVPQFQKLLNSSIRSSRRGAPQKQVVRRAMFWDPDAMAIQTSTSDTVALAKSALWG